MASDIKSQRLSSSNRPHVSSMDLRSICNIEQPLHSTGTDTWWDSSFNDDNATHRCINHHPETTLSNISAIAGLWRTHASLNAEHIIFKCAARMLLHTTASFQLGMRYRRRILKDIACSPTLSNLCQMTPWLFLTSVQNTAQLIIHNIYQFFMKHYFLPDLAPKSPNLGQFTKDQSSV